MEKIFMASGILAGIVIVIVGLFKLTIKKYKDKGWYKPLLTGITLVLTIAVCLLCEEFILELPIISWSFLILLFATIAEVFVSYNGIYEGFGIKEGINKLITYWKELKTLSPEAKAVKAVEKVEDKLIALYNANKETFDNTMIAIRQKAESEKAINE